MKICCKLNRCTQHIKSFLKEYHYLFTIALIALVVAISGKWMLGDDGYWGGIAVELTGVFWEVLLITLILGVYEKNRRKNDNIRDLLRRINDFKRLDEDYSKAVIGSALRELREIGVTTPYDFRGMTLSNFSFLTDFDIKDIKGSVFSDGYYVFQQRNNFTKLSKVGFEGVNCENVVFNKGNLSFTTYEDCSFYGSNLQGASFQGSELLWSQDQIIENTNDWHEDVGDNPDENPILKQKYFPPFYNADLNGVIFDKCNFKFCDFRGAENILNASFKDVRGIGTCYFDEGVLEELKATGRLTEINNG